MIPILNVAFNKTANNCKIMMVSRHIHFQIYVITSFSVLLKAFSIIIVAFFFLRELKVNILKYELKVMKV